MCDFKNASHIQNNQEREMRVCLVIRAHGSKDEVLRPLQQPGLTQNGKVFMKNVDSVKILLLWVQVIPLVIIVKTVDALNFQDLTSFVTFIQLIIRS